MTHGALFPDSARPGAAAGGRAAGPGKAAREDQRRIVELTEQQFRILLDVSLN